MLKVEQSNMTFWCIEYLNTLKYAISKFKNNENVIEISKYDLYLQNVNGCETIIKHFFLTNIVLYKKII